MKSRLPLWGAWFFRELKDFYGKCRAKFRKKLGNDWSLFLISSARTGKNGP
jgi:hypothetical protein